MSIAAHFLCVCLSACLCACVFVASRWWEWTHMPWHRGHRAPPPTTTTTNYHHLLSPLHKRSLTTSDPTGIHSDWLKVLAVARQEQCSVVSERKRREGGYVDMHGGEEKGERNSLPLVLPPYKPRSRAVSQQARNKREAYFSIWGRKELGMAAKRSSPWQHKASASRAQIAF